MASDAQIQNLENVTATGVKRTRAGNGVVETEFHSPDELRKARRSLDRKRQRRRRPASFSISQGSM